MHFLFVLAAGRLVTIQAGGLVRKERAAKHSATQEPWNSALRNNGIALDVQRDRMYWTDHANGKILTAYLNGTDAKALEFAPHKYSDKEPWGLPPHKPSAVALDLDHERIYWTDWSRQGLFRSKLDGTDASYLLGFGVTARPVGIALDGVHSDMYWADRDLASIHRADLDGKGATVLVSDEGHVTNDPQLYAPYDLALDVAEGHMYFTDTGYLHMACLEPPETWGPPGPTGEQGCWGTHKIKRANLDGTQVTDLVSGLAWPAGIALDLTARHVYWTDSRTGKVQRANLDGTEVTDLVAGGEPTGLALDVAAGSLYYVDRGHVMRTSLDGGRPTVVA